MYTTATIFLCIFVLCIGVAIGALVERARKKGSTPPSTPPSQFSSEKLAQDGDIKVLSAWRKRNSQVWLDMDGKRLETKEALLPEQQQRLLGLVLDLRPWLEMVRPTAPGSGITPLPLRNAEPVVGVASQTAQPEKKKSPLTNEEAVPAPTVMSIIEQIDNILQVKMATSAFKERGIRLTEGPGGIVIIKDGSNRYEGVDAVPDPEIKSLIRQAVADWEKGAR